MRPIRAGFLALSLLAFPGMAPASAGAATSAPPAVLVHGPRTQPRIALTFDACTTRDPSPYDPRVASVLEALRVPATIFVGGGWAEEEAPRLRALARDPLFEIGNHTFTHPHLTHLSDQAIREELERTQAVVASVTSRVPTLFRPPYGEYDERVVRVAASLGLTTVEYDLASGDPDPHATKDALVRWVLGEARPGSIVVMHLNHARFHTAEALPEIVVGLRARGYELVTVGELLRAEGAPASAFPVAAAHPAEVRRRSRPAPPRPAAHA